MHTLDCTLARHTYIHTYFSSYVYLRILDFVRSYMCMCVYVCGFGVCVCLDRIAFSIRARPVRQVSRGNMLFRVAAEDERSAEGITPFVIFFLGANMRRKLTRVCESLGVRLYLYPDSAMDLRAQSDQNNRQVETLTQVQTSTRAALEVHAHTHTRMHARMSMMQ
jgi:hypothetical protein